MPAKNKTTWTEIAIQLTGYVPMSCRLLDDGRMRVQLKRGEYVDTMYFPKKEVDAARKELAAIAKAEQPKAPQRPRTTTTKKPASQPKRKPGPKPKAAAPPKSPPNGKDIQGGGKRKIE